MNDQIKTSKDVLLQELTDAINGHQDDAIVNSIVYKIPISPQLAIAGKYAFGMEALKGYDLSEAKKAYPNEF